MQLTIARMVSDSIDDIRQQDKNQDLMVTSLFRIIPKVWDENFCLPDAFIWKWFLVHLWILAVVTGVYMIALNGIMGGSNYTLNTQNICEVKTYPLNCV